MIVIFKQALHELFRERTRIILTILAIAWGTFTIATMLAIGEGLRVNFASTVANSGDNLLTLTGMSTSKAYQGTPQNAPISLTSQDFNSIRAIPNIIKASPQYGFQRQITYKDKNSNVSIYGVNADYNIIHQITTIGRFISPIDIEQRRAVIVLGTEAKKQLFSNEDNPVGKIVYINHQPFLVIGVMKDKPQMIAEQMPDAYLNWMPFSTYELIVNPSSIDTIVLTYQNPKLLAVTKKQIQKLVALNHHADPNDDNLIDFDDLASRQEKINNFFWGMEIFLGIIGTLTLIIAGVGIANVMLASIHRSIREIGMRMAIGAKTYHIMLHYTLESFNATILGGAIGILFSYATILLIKLIPMKGRLIDVIGKPTPILSLTVLLTVVGILGCIGFLAGFLPALRAAKIDPSEALRYE